MGSFVYLGTNYLVHWFNALEVVTALFFSVQLLLEWSLLSLRGLQGPEGLKQHWVSQTSPSHNLCPTWPCPRMWCQTPRTNQSLPQRCHSRADLLFTEAQPYSIWTFPPSPVHPRTHVPTLREVLMPGAAAAINCPQMSCSCLRRWITPRLCE